jgi:phospholipid/cholesterol/gamma-HCH transport system substrate-binding protein
MTMRRKRSGRTEPPNFTVIGILGALVIAAIVYIVFAKQLPFEQSYDINAVVRTANQLRDGSPVRIAGVDVGQVKSLSKGPGATTVVHMTLDSHPDQVRKDAQLRIRPRLFLEGGFYVDLQPGSPTAPELGRGGTIPLGQTAGPVQINDILGVLDNPGRTSLRNDVARFSGTLEQGGAEGVRRSLPAFRGALRPLAQTLQASLGTEAHDVSRLVRGADVTLETLAAGDTHLDRFVDGLSRTSSILGSEDQQLGATVEGTDRVLQHAPAALRAADAALPPTIALADRLRPALAVMPGALRSTDQLLTQVQAVTSRAELPRLLNRLAPALQALPSTERALPGLFDLVTPVSECIHQRVSPALRAHLDDGPLTTGLPVWQELQQAAVGLAGSSGSFDANGSFIRYVAAMGPDTLNVESLTGVGHTVAAAEPTKLRVRPLLLPHGQQPALRPDAKCVDQPAPQLQSGETPIHAFDDAKTTARLSPQDIKRLVASIEAKLSKERR